MIKQILILPALVALCAVPLYAQEDEDNALAGVKCVVAGDNSAKLEHAAKHLDGEVYFCCPKCKEKFEANPEKFQTKANHQLVVTGQYEQVACPVTGMKLVDNMSLKIGTATVGFCCGRCKASVENAGDLEQQAELVFSKEAFSKGFAPANNLKDITCPVGNGEVSKEFSAEYRNGTVFFCCKGCVQKFKDNPQEFAVLANYQLVATGQYKQIHCPFSGMDLKEGADVKVGLVKIGMCCNDCQKKVAEAEGEEQMAMVFSDDAFEKAFEPSQPKENKKD